VASSSGFPDAIGEASIHLNVGLGSSAATYARGRGKADDMWWKDFPEFDPGSNYPDPSQKQLAYADQAKTELRKLKTTLEKLTVPQQRAIIARLSRSVYRDVAPGGRCRSCIDRDRGAGTRERRASAHRGIPNRRIGNLGLEFVRMTLAGRLCVLGCVCDLVASFGSLFDRFHPLDGFGGRYRCHPLFFDAECRVDVVPLDRIGGLDLHLSREADDKRARHNLAGITKPNAVISESLDLFIRHS
jgi:hypothetical protein